MKRKKKKTFFSEIRSAIKNIFFSGVIAIFPLTITIFIVHFSYTIIANWLEPLKKIEPAFLQKIPGVEFVIVLLFIFLIGMLVKLFIIEPIIHYGERLITKIPLIRTIYSSAKKLVDFFDIPKHKEKIGRQVVLIEYPKNNFYNLAFLLGPADQGFVHAITKQKEDNDEEFVRVFMPNAPNPTTGYFFILPKSKVTPLSITFEEAIKTIVSCGLITPETLQKTPHDS